MNEELFSKYEVLKVTSHEKINQADSNGRTRKNVIEMIGPLENPSAFAGTSNMKDALNRLIQSFSGA